MLHPIATSPSPWTIVKAASEAADVEWDEFFAPIRAIAKGVGDDDIPSDAYFAEIMAMGTV